MPLEEGENAWKYTDAQFVQVAQIHALYRRHPTKFIGHMLVIYWTTSHARHYSAFKGHCCVTQCLQKMVSLPCDWKNFVHIETYRRSRFHTRNLKHMLAFDRLSYTWYHISYRWKLHNIRTLKYSGLALQMMLTFRLLPRLSVFSMSILVGSSSFCVWMLKCVGHSLLDELWIFQASLRDWFHEWPWRRDTPSVLVQWKLQVDQWRKLIVSKCNER